MQDKTTREVLTEVLSERICPSQSHVRRELAKRGVHITQASVSRLLQRAGAVKTELPNGTVAYRLHKGTVVQRATGARLNQATVAQHLAERIIGNGSVYIILGKPDSGRLLGTYVDDAAFPSIAGTIAGGNTLLVVPQATRRYRQTMYDLKVLFPKVTFEMN